METISTDECSVCGSDHLLKKLTDSLEITGFNMDDLRLQLSHTTTISVNKFAGRSYD
jgi:hypothetical protein